MYPKQKGMLVLSSAMILIMIMGAYLLFFELKTLNDIRISSNHYRAEQALQAAEAGLNYGTAFVINTPIGAAAPAATAVSTSTINSLLGANNGQVSSISSSLLSTDEYKIIATAQSSDGTATRTVETIVLVSAGVPSASGYKLTGWKDY